MKPNLTKLTTNPCKMCMPMGAVMALSGIAECQVMLHGSQGCSTYIRRHMATHFNEPVDIASSSLTEEGTVYGGASNLMTGLDNLNKVYQPKIIGLATTCLAETIGEDIHGLAKTYSQENDNTVSVVPISTPGYAGTQFEGYFRALHALVSQLVKPGPVVARKTGRPRLNLISGPISPADARYLKSTCEVFGLDAILLPDTSETMDGGYGQDNLLLKQGGTTLEQIASMKDADMTIELTSFVLDRYSPGKWLEEAYNVPCKQINLPIGLRGCDEFFKILAKLSGAMPAPIRKARLRYLDAMVDSHKYNIRGRAVIFGEPDLSYAILRLCSEIGVKPVVTATGSANPDWRDRCLLEATETAKLHGEESYTVLDDTDFLTIENQLEKTRGNLLVGSSDGRRITEKTGIPLIRCMFPIHDRIGGQRINLLGYEGSLTLIDQMTNTLLKRKEESYREQIAIKYLKPKQVETERVVNKPGKTLAEKTENHPCFSAGAACSQGRIHLAVAPKCNIQCNYCVRSYDCMNESRPGVTSKILSPDAALDHYLMAREKVKNLSVVGIAGPGDALANLDETVKTFRLIREQDPDVTFCLSTNGLMLPYYADQLIELGVSHLTVTINAIDPKIGAKIYKHINYISQTLVGEDAAATLINNQLGGVKYLADQGMVVKVNTVMIQGINDHHIETVVKTVKALGAQISNIMPLIPVSGSAFEDLPATGKSELNQLRKTCGVHLKQMYHCRQCRADAIGMLDDDQSTDLATECIAASKHEVRQETVPEDGVASRVAVFSQSGYLVDQHFGEASEASIYETGNGRPRLVETRLFDQYCQGDSQCGHQPERLDKMLSALEDCQAVMTMKIGEVPKTNLQDMGIDVITTYEPIMEALARLVIANHKEGKHK